jgi:hypothetical protein
MGSRKLLLDLAQPALAVAEPAHRLRELLLGNLLLALAQRPDALEAEAKAGVGHGFLIGLQEEVLNVRQFHITIGKTK